MSRNKATQGNLLIVDDTPANLRLLSRMLTEHGYKVRAVRNGPHALQAAQAAQPDLILLDIVMPDMDGYEVCRRLKTEERTRDIPILFISALSDVEDKVKALTYGGVDYITKPFQLEEVLARVRTHLALRNLTQQLQEANAQLAYQVQELRTRNEELDTFAHTVAHDIKSPLTSIVGYANLLVEEFDKLAEPLRAEILRMIEYSASKMSGIVDELLLLASVRKVDVALQPMDMGDAVDEACKHLATLVKEFQAEIHLPPEWPQVLGHASWIEEVWVNYLSNGCKYGGKPPRLELGWDRQTASSHIRFWVRDNGEGIPPEEQERLFAPFTRLDQVQVKGHGLGLSIVRRIMEKLGGQVGVESEVGAGSLFYFTLPADESQQT